MKDASIEDIRVVFPSTVVVVHIFTARVPKQCLGVSFTSAEVELVGEVI
jgi:hypothetical protein